MSRPYGATYWRRYDWPHLEKMRNWLESSASTFAGPREASRLVSTSAHNAGIMVSDYSIQRRLTRAYPLYQQYCAQLQNRSS